MQKTLYLLLKIKFTGRENLEHLEQGNSNGGYNYHLYQSCLQNDPKNRLSIDSRLLKETIKAAKLTIQVSVPK